MFDTLIKLDKDREVLDFYATDKRATKELLIRENFRETIYEPACGQGYIFTFHSGSILIVFKISFILFVSTLHSILVLF